MNRESIDRFANEANLIRFRKRVSEANTPSEIRLANELLAQQEVIALGLPDRHRQL